MAELKVTSSKSFSGMCDASAGVLVGDTHMVVANDEDNLLRVYRSESEGRPVQEIDLDGFLQASTKDEADLEAAATLDDVVFWIGSHGRNKKGKESVSRQVFFGTRFSLDDDSVKAEFVGQPYRRLLHDLLAAPQLLPFKLLEASRLPPKEKGGLSIEGLAATREGHLLIGFRNPIPRGKALLIPVLNPRQILDGEPARLGEPQLLDLGGLGIRDIVLAQERYLVLAGAFDGRQDFRLFEWNGKGEPRLLSTLPTIANPEALMVSPKSYSRIEILTDNGSTVTDRVACKDLKKSDQKYFRSYSLHLE